MYRTPDETPRCACCHSLELTEVTRFDPSDGFSNVWFAKKDAGSGWLAASQESFPIGRARVRLACGHVMWALASKELERLRQRLPQFSALPDK